MTGVTILAKREEAPRPSKSGGGDRQIRRAISLQLACPVKYMPRYYTFEQHLTQQATILRHLSVSPAGLKLGHLPHEPRVARHDI